MAYSPDPTDVAAPADVGIAASTAPAEFRALKQYIKDRAALAAVKSADTDRTNTTTVAADDHLVVAVPVGTFKFQALLMFSKLAGTPGIRFSAFMMNPGTSSAGAYGGAGNVNNGTYAKFLQQLGLQNDIGSITTFVSEPFDQVLVSGFVVVSVAGNFTIGWAQSLSSASATRMHRGSWLKLEKLA